MRSMRWPCSTRPRLTSGSAGATLSPVVTVVDAYGNPDNDASSTVTRIFTGYALDPVNNLLNEFLPDVASHVHVRIIFVQRILAGGTYEKRIERLVEQAA